MAGPIDMTGQLVGNAVRLAWYSGLGWALRRMPASGVPATASTSTFQPRGPVPSRAELLADIRSLLWADAKAVREGLYPPLPPEEVGFLDHVRRIRAMADDVPRAAERRQARDAGTARDVDGADGLPDYYAQDFHFQTGGYLTAESARLYDVQVETLFSGSAAAMRRAGLRAIARFMRGRDQRQVSLIDVACGTGRFLRDVRLAFPAIELTGIDLSEAYLAEATAHLGRLRPARLIVGNAEAMPLADASQDIVTSVFLFHELPPEVRRTVASEMARVLKPGGRLVFIDSLQMGDRPGWDGLLESFPQRFHEPYYRHYAIDDLDALFTEAGLVADGSEIAFLSKVLVRRKA
ncbi:MAG: class I SAM-dependent methyltransferase [Hyphomicrobiaceae bacterium]|nr:class I SAM-dependent methyltransferase [Hyphomicrobiaceae bacterium]